MIFKNWLDTRPEMKTRDPYVYPTILGGVSRGFWTSFVVPGAWSAIFWHVKTPKGISKIKKKCFSGHPNIQVCFKYKTEITDKTQIYENVPSATWKVFWRMTDHLCYFRSEWVSRSALSYDTAALNVVNFFLKHLNVWNTLLITFASVLSELADAALIRFALCPEGGGGMLWSKFFF